MYLDSKAGSGQTIRRIVLFTLLLIAVGGLGVSRASAQTEVKLTTSDAAARDGFGGSVSIDGDRVTEKRYCF